MAWVRVAVEPVERHNAIGIAVDEDGSLDSRLFEDPTECAGVIGGPPLGWTPDDGRAWV